MSLQREPDLVLKNGGKDPKASEWPAFLMRKNKLELGDLKGVFDKSTTRAYEQSHPYGKMLYPGEDLAIDEVAKDNKYMQLIFGGEPGPQETAHLAYNHTVRQIAEAPMERDSLLETMNPMSFVEGAPASKDSLLETFAEQRTYYKGAVDSDAERALKQRPTHRMISTTLYGKKQQRTNHVRGQAHLLHRPKNDGSFRPQENLSSRTFAPMEDGGEVPLNFELAFGPDPRNVRVTGEAGKMMAPKNVSQHSSWVDTGNYVGREIDRQVLAFEEDQNPQFRAMFAETIKKRM